MSLWILLDGGHSVPKPNNVGRRLVLWWGRLQAVRHRRVSVGRRVAISPDSRIHPRKGAIRIGDCCRIGPGVILQGNVQLGDHCSIQAYSVVVGYGTPDQPDGLIRIGNHVMIAPHVQIIASDHVFDDLDRPMGEQGMRHRPIVIEDDVWGGGRVVILAGVTVGRGSVLAAGAVVTADVAPYSVMGGVPARLLKQRTRGKGGSAEPD
jgi:acetyltransferase-like isoleucine patch superfamily enzyme